MGNIIEYGGKKPVIPNSVFIAPNATIIGDVELGEESSVWFGVVIRGDVHYIRIGDRTNIQDNSVLHVEHNTFPLVIGNDVTIGHAAIVHGCTIEDNCLIGMGAIILNGAKIGRDSIIGAGALVKEGQEIPPRSLAVGVPAKVIRQLTDEQVEMIRESAKHYVEYAKTYLQNR